MLLSDGGDGDQYTQMKPPPPPPPPPIIIAAIVVVVVIITIIVDGYTNVYNVLSLDCTEWISGECTIVIEAFFQIGRLLWMYAGYYLNQQQQVVQEGWIDTLSW